MKNKLFLLLAVFFLLCLPKVNFGQAPTLGVASGFALFTATGAFGNTGMSSVTGDIGTNAGAFTGFPPGIVTGNIHVADLTSTQAATDVASAYGYLSVMTCGVVIGTTLGNGQVLSPNVYCLGAASVLNGNLTLDGGGNPNALFIFKINGAFSTSNLSKVLLINSASFCNVYWQINGQCDLGTYSVFNGTIVANGAINLKFGSYLIGRVLSQVGAINISSSIAVLPPACNGIQGGSPPIVIADTANNITGTSFSANWDIADDATSYYIDVSPSSDFSTFVSGYNNLFVGNGSTITYNITGLNPGTIYYYRVRGANSYGQGPNSNPVTVAISSIIPTLSQWGIIIFALILLSMGIFILQRRRNAFLKNRR